MSNTSFNVPNTITVARIVLALFTLSLLWQTSNQALLVAFGLTAIVIYADALDGYFARKLNQSSKFGGMFDIAGDRIVEMSYWIVFAVLNWIPAWVPLLFLVRGALVDVVRGFAAEKGYTAFGASTMMRSAFGKFLVASNFSRFTYAVAKAAAFCLLIAAHTSYAKGLETTALSFVYISCVFCVIRGLPVILESSAIFK